MYTHICTHIMSDIFIRAKTRENIFIYCMAIKSVNAKLINFLLQGKIAYYEFNPFHFSGLDLFIRVCSNRIEMMKLSEINCSSPPPASKYVAQRLQFLEWFKI